MKIVPWEWLDRPKAKKGLEEISDILTKNNVIHWLQFGTLLGAMREGTFLVHDFDVDLGIYYEGYKKILSLGTSLRSRGILVGDYRIVPENIPQMICISHYNVKFDLYIFYIKNNKSRYIKFKNKARPLQWEVWEADSKYHQNLDKINFLGREYFCPSFREEYIDLLYGNNWRKPNFGSITGKNAFFYGTLKEFIPESVLKQCKL